MSRVKTSSSDLGGVRVCQRGIDYSSVCNLQVSGWTSRGDWEAATAARGGGGEEGLGDPSHRLLSSSPSRSAIFACVYKLSFFFRACRAREYANQLQRILRYILGTPESTRRIVDRSRGTTCTLRDSSDEIDRRIKRPVCASRTLPSRSICSL